MEIQVDAFPRLDAFGKQADTQLQLRRTLERASGSIYADSVFDGVPDGAHTCGNYSYPVPDYSPHRFKYVGDPVHYFEDVYDDFHQWYEQFSR